MTWDIMKSENLCFLLDFSPRIACSNWILSQAAHGQAAFRIL